MGARHAVYLLPGALSPDVLRGLGESWLGRRADGGELRAPVPSGWAPTELAEIRPGARRYGFHATVKAPFRLAAGIEVATLDAALATLAQATAPVVLPRLSFRWLDGFAALVPGAPSSAMGAVADRVVRELDVLRAPLSAAERARRRPERLSSRQRELLDRFGYPYVLEEYRVHFTLTDRLAPDRHARVERAAREHFAPRLDADVPIDALCRFLEPAPGRPLILGAVHPLGS